MKVVLASKSQIKISAVTQALKKHNISATLISVEVDSGVSMQPINEETLQGAKNRVIAAKEICPDADVYIAIENGLFAGQNSAHYLDKAIILVSTYDGKELVVESAAFLFPDEFNYVIEQARNIGFNKTTVGKELVKLGKIKQHDNFHEELGNKSRVDFLIESFSQISEFLNQIPLYKQPSEEQPLVVDSNVIKIVKHLETLGLNMKIEDLNSLIEALDRNLEKPAVRARYFAYQNAEDNNLEMVKQTPRYPIDSEGYAVAFDPLENEANFWNVWSTYGFIVGKEVVSKETCNQATNRIKKISNELSHGKFSIDDPITYKHIPIDKNNTPLISRGFFEIYHDNILAQLRQSLRMYLFHVILWGKTDLWTTFDRFGVKLPSNKDSVGLPLHVDQNPTVEEKFETLQGVLALENCPLERGTYSVVPGSRHAFQQYVEVVKQHERPNYVGEYVELKNNQSLEAVLKENKQDIPLRGGDIVSWDSRTTHANTPNISDKARMVGYISARPKPKENLEYLTSERRNCFFSGLGKNLRAAGLHASMKPRFTDQEVVNKVREEEELSPLGELLYGFKGFN